jgi:predicted metal-dependent enzyme (double-stranded beta helix superfamily)
MQLAQNLAAAAPWQRLVQPAPSAADPLQQARTLLEAIMADREAIAALPLVRTPLRYERNFLFGDETMSVWAMTWAAGSATSIHDHHCSCCFGIISGELTERRFENVEADRVVQTFERIRGPGFIACMMPTGPNIHQMLNVSAEEALSIHVYGFDRTRHASSVATTSRSRLPRPASERFGAAFDQSLDRRLRRCESLSVPGDLRAAAGSSGRCGIDPLAPYQQSDCNHAGRRRDGKKERR